MKVRPHNPSLVFILIFFIRLTYGQQPYFPNSTWQTKKPAELKLIAQLIDSVVSFALQNDGKTDYDLRIANLKAYAKKPQVPGFSCAAYPRHLYF